MRDPDLKGPAGQAWKTPIEPGPHTSLALWLINVPKAHPHWSWWTVGVIHLRDVEGLPPAKKHYPEAAYEFLIMALNPERCPEPVLDPSSWSFLSPADVVEQFHGMIDIEAVRLCEQAVRAIMDGRLSPDQDFRSAWHNTIQTTAEHYRQGKHAIQ